MRIKIKLNFLVILFLLTVTLNANDKLFLLPKQANEAQKEIETLIENASSNIDVAMYNFSLKSFSKALIKAKQKGVKVRVFLDKEKTEDKSSEYKLLKTNGIEVIKISNTKLHTKLAIFDKKVAVFGSSNWASESFEGNYEIIYVCEQNDVLDRLNGFIKELKEK